MDAYRTVVQEAKAEFTEKRSRFIGCIRPAASEEEALAFFTRLKKEYWDADHHVTAYVLREGQARRYSDDGEPQGTAGMPVLDVLLKAELVDCAVMVIRYFGGILLGTGGLVRAYSHGAALTVGAAGIVDMRPCARLVLHCDYARLGMAEPLILSCGGVLDACDYAEEVTLHFHMPMDRLPQFEKQLTEKSAGRLLAEVKGEAFYPFARS